MLKLVCGYAVAADTATLHTVYGTIDVRRAITIVVVTIHRQSCNARAGTQCYSLRVAS